MCVIHMGCNVCMVWVAFSVHTCVCVHPLIDICCGLFYLKRYPQKQDSPDIYMLYMNYTSVNLNLLLYIYVYIMLLL